MLTSDGPHQTNIGNRELRQMLTAMRRLCGQSCEGPNGVADQSRSSRSRAVGDSPSVPGPPSSKGWGLEGVSDIGAEFSGAAPASLQANRATQGSALAWSSNASAS